MLMTEKGRAAKKRSQLAFNKAATQPGFAQFFGAMPSQLKKGAEEREIRRQERAIRNAAANAREAVTIEDADYLSGTLQTPSAGDTPDAGDTPEREDPGSSGGMQT